MSASVDDEKVPMAGTGESSGKRQVGMSMQARDQARIEQLKGSIAKIEEQIESTRRQLDAVCETLRTDKDFAGAPSILPITNDTTKDTDVSPQLSPSCDLSNEQIVEKARTMVNGHIKSLTKYNQLKDIAMSLSELIAEHKGIRVSEVLRDEGVELSE